MVEPQCVDPAEVGLDPKRYDLLDQRCKEWTENGPHPSIVALVARHGKVVFHKAFGKMGPEPAASDTQVDTVYPISSVSKPIVASLALMLAEDGLLQLNISASLYLPELSGEGTDMLRVDHLLTHQSGWQDGTTSEYTAEKLKKPLDIGEIDDTQHKTVERVLKACWDMPVVHKPGTRMDYCAHNFELVGEIIRRISGQSLQEFSQARLFEPLGMTDTSFRLLDDLRGRVVKRPPSPPGSPQDLNSDKALDIPWASGGVLSTAADLMKFGQLFLDGGIADGKRVLSKVAIGEMTRSQIPRDIKSYFFRAFDGVEIDAGQASYGLGWFVQGEQKAPPNGMFQSTGTFAHMGSGGARLFVCPEHQLVGVWLGIDLGLMQPGFSRYPHFQDMVMASIVD